MTGGRYGFGCVLADLRDPPIASDVATRTAAALIAGRLRHGGLALPFRVAVAGLDPDLGRDAVSLLVAEGRVRLVGRDESSAQLLLTEAAR